MKSYRIDYTPLDRILEIPAVRLLRALRRFDWVLAQDLYDATGAADFSIGDVPQARGSRQHNPERNCLSVALTRLVREGFVARRGGGPNALHRITVRGRRHLSRRLAVDMRSEWAPARPGTEDLLCA